MRNGNRSSAAKEKIVGVVAIVLSIISVLLVFESVGQEPFLRFSTRFALTQIAVASIVAFLWFALIVVAVIWAKGHTFQRIIMIIWGLIFLCMTCNVPRMFMDDVTKFQNERESSLSNSNSLIPEGSNNSSVAK